MSIVLKIVDYWNVKHLHKRGVDVSDFSIVDTTSMNIEGDHNSMDAYNYLMPCFEGDDDDEDPIYDYAPAA